MTSNFWWLLLKWPQDLRNFVMGWLLVLGLNEGLVECATVCVKSRVILTYNNQHNSNFSNEMAKNGILFSKLFWPSMRKYCSSDHDIFFWNLRLRICKSFEITKGQLISKANFLVLIYTKNPTKLFFDFCPSL